MCRHFWYISPDSATIILPAKTSNLVFFLWEVYLIYINKNASIALDLRERYFFLFSDTKVKNRLYGNKGFVLRSKVPASLFQLKRKVMYIKPNKNCTQKF